MKKKIFVLLVWLVATLNVMPQVVHTNFQNVTPSPQAYAFAQYAEMPVSLFTGTPSINIPLFTIETGLHSFPISLSYHASGIKVSQEASWVGLGWNLNVGGSISRSVRGRDDFYYAASEERVNLSHAGMPGEYIYMNGKLLQHNVYLGEKLHQATSNVYEELAIDSLNAWYQDNYDLGAILPYRVPVTHCRLKTSTEDTYDPESEAVNRSVTSYAYNTKNYMPSVVSQQNGTDKRVTETTYPVDLRNTAVFDGMCKNNMVTTPVEVRIYENGILSRKELHLYKKHTGNGSYIPSMDYSYYYGSSKPATNFTGSNVSQYGTPDITYSEYDAFNNRLEVKTRTGQSAVYLWGYNGQYPIVQIFNATLAEVKAAGITDPQTFASGAVPTASDWNKLHGLRKLLPQASISIFQYDPLVGVTVATDSRGMNTYYEYDAMGRLAVERDNDRHIIKTYHYTLKNER